jgi:hypothetical protein
MNERQVDLLIDRAREDSEFAGAIAAAPSMDAIGVIAARSGMPTNGDSIPEATLNRAEVEEIAGGRFACSNNSLATVGVTCTVFQDCRRS